MIGNEYLKRRQNVIDKFDRYKAKRGSIEDGVDIKHLEKRVESLKNRKYILAIAGEVSAGKSTFINALLGTELLPADVLQATSAIVEIYKAKTSCLRVEFANGAIEEISDDLDTPYIDEAKLKLQDICCLKDEYREIPTTLLNEYIIANKSNKKLKVSLNDLVANLERDSGLNLAKKKPIIEKYIEEHTLATIPVKIEFGYPLKWDFDEFRIVDTPGVNALGGVQNISFNYFNEADAILFVHPIKPIESESFRRFVKQTIMNRSKETLFLILSNACQHPDDSVDKLHKEATDKYSQLIPHERILPVDSLLQIILNEMQAGKSIDKITQNNEEKGIAVARYRLKADKDEDKLEQLIKQAARFEKVSEAIDKFAMGSRNTQLIDIMKSIRLGIKNQKEALVKKKKSLEIKQEDPVKFAREIKNSKELIEKRKNNLYKATEEIKSGKSGINSKWYQEIENMEKHFIETIDKCESFDSIRKTVTEAIELIENQIARFVEEISTSINKMLIDIEEKIENTYIFTIPKLDLSAIEDHTKKESFKTKKIYKTRPLRWFDLMTFGLTWLLGDNKEDTGKTEQVYDESDHINKLRDECKKDMIEPYRSSKEHNKKIVNIYFKQFEAKIKKSIEDTEKNIEVLGKQKETSDELTEEINRIEQDIKEIEPELNGLENLLRDMQ